MCYFCYIEFTFYYDTKSMQPTCLACHSCWQVEIVLGLVGCQTWSHPLQYICSMIGPITVCCFVWVFWKENHYAPVSQANWCNMTFYSWQSFLLSFMLWVTRVKPPWDSNPAWEADDLPAGLFLPITMAHRPEPAITL